MESVVLEHPVSGSEEKDLSCIRLLLLWDRGEHGQGKSFNNLSIKLRQIGEPELADKISDMVFTEEADAVCNNSIFLKK